MKRVNVALMGLMLIAASSCKKAEKVQVEEPKEWVVSTFAGSGPNASAGGYTDGVGELTSFNWIQGIAIDGSGNVFVADRNNNRIRKVTPEGVVSTVAGNGIAGYADGASTVAQFDHPSSLTIDNSGNLYISDSWNHRIRKITPAGVVSTLAGNGDDGFADGQGSTAVFSEVQDITIDGSNNLYVADPYNCRIRKVTPGGIVSTVAGNGQEKTVDGPIATASLNQPWGIAIDPSGNIYTSQFATNNYVIRKISKDGIVSSLAGGVGNKAYGDGFGAAAKFGQLAGMCIDGNGNLYVADSGNYNIRKISPERVVTTVAGNEVTRGYVNGSPEKSQFISPFDIAVDKKGDVYVADGTGNRIRKIAAVILPKSQEVLDKDNWNKPKNWQ